MLEKFIARKIIQNFDSPNYGLMITCAYFSELKNEMRFGFVFRLVQALLPPPTTAPTTATHTTAPTTTIRGSNSEGRPYPTLVVEVGISEITGVGFSANACNTPGIQNYQFTFLPLNFSMVPLVVSLLGQLMGFIWIYGNYKI
ncbi:hypothetical protein Glove_225g54 [Diversispora epigaea]|uniref:Uncharacterized protein n=1 Tax=Diversispora epigaea TaxID=1348612 RepID=A0A397INQ4_9GLOM|nr:hypothetical protein Glove_225g54 [Diversispora epigaea]